MEIKMDILQNSKDYFRQSIELADIADEFGNHDKEKTRNNNKIKWKLAFICLVQSLELLCKKCLVDINDNLIYKDIDIENTSFAPTINLATAFSRMNKFLKITFDEGQIRLIEKSIRWRNEFIHNNVKIKTEELKTIYCRLLKLYTKIYLQFVDNEFFINTRNRGYGNFMFYNDNLVPYRGSEIFKADLEEETQSVKENQKYHYYISEGIKYERVVYGSEEKRFPELFNKLSNGSVYKYKYCSDCLAMLGEYHGEFCDLEICPKCKGQMLTCGCFDKYHYE